MPVATLTSGKRKLDAPQIIEIIQFKREHWRLEQRDLDEMEYMRDGIEGGFILLAQSEGRVVGTIAFIPMDGKEYDYELAKFTVDSSLRGGGIGRKLVVAALKRADAEGKGRSSLFDRGDLLMERLSGDNAR